jgi:hypothetical protein
VVEPDALDRLAGDVHELMLHGFRQAAGILEALERDRAGVHCSVDDPEAMHCAAMDIAVHVDLDALERLLADEVMGVADTDVGDQIAHQVVEGLHEPPDQAH